MKYKVVLFDADGVTIKEGKLFSEVLAEQYGIPMEKMIPFFTGIFQDCLVGKADVKQELTKVVNEWGWQGSVDELMSLWFSTGDELNEEVTALIKRLKAEKIQCYLVTNQEKYRGQYLRERTSSLFEDVFVSGEIGHKKDEREFYEYIDKEIQDRVSEKQLVLLIDDDKKNIDAAKKFGFDTIYYQKFEDISKLS